MTRTKLENTIIGDWSVMDYKGGGVYSCLCKCGNVCDVKACNLLTNKTKRCADCKIKNQKQERYKSKVGQKFNKWTILSQTSRNNCRALCDCGLEWDVDIRNIVKGLSKGCKACGNTSIGYEQSASNRIWEEYKRGAEKRNYCFELTKEDVSNLVENDCFYCGKNIDEEPVCMKKTGKYSKPFMYNGIDRIDNKLGYALDNVVTCCMVCNRAKNNLPYDIFCNWINRIKQ